MKEYYSHFLKNHGKTIHLAGHSHHFWPDISLKGQMEYWEDSAKLSDEKWDYIFNHKLPKAQELIAQILHFNRPQDIAFAPNTHELLYRVFSCKLYRGRPVKVLTSDSEFHSFRRQIQRLEEENLVEVIRLNPLEVNFERKLLEQTPSADIVFLSQVFFNNGKVLSNSLIKSVAQAARPDTFVCIDGYHAFCAIPVELNEVYDRIFYLAGGYKYAQAGEGMCFMTLPQNCKLRPINTGWWASFEELESSQQSVVSYSPNGMRFSGSTQDMSAMYRFVAIWEHFFAQGITPENIHKKVRRLMEYFLSKLELRNRLVVKELDQIGHFLTLEFPNTEKCASAHEFLKENSIQADYRGQRLRFGFTPYLDEHDLDRALVAINSPNMKGLFS